MPPTNPALRKRSKNARPAVLIAEDDAIYVRLLSDVVVAEGWTAVTATDAAQAVMYATRSDPFAVLLDINMPAGSGVTALDRIKKNAKTRNLPILVVTGSTEPGLERRVRELGATAIVSKPFDPSELRLFLRQALAHREAQRAAS